MLSKKTSSIIIALLLVIGIILNTNSITNAAGSDSAASSSYDEKTEELRKEIVSSATDYLIDSMNDDGSFTGSYPYNTTTDVYRILSDYTDADVSTTKDWIDSQNIADEVDPLARKAFALKDENVLEEALKHQAVDGGFGITKEYMADNLDSMLVLRAIQKGHETERENILNSLDTLMNEDGGFSFTKDSDSDIILSSEILYYVYSSTSENDAESVSDIPDSFNKTKEYISKSYTGDFNKEHIEESLYVLLAMEKTGEAVDYSETVNSISNIQSDDGSFYGDDHTTALVIWYLGSIDSKYVSQKDATDDNASSNENQNDKVTDQSKQNTPDNRNKTDVRVDKEEGNKNDLSDNDSGNKSDDKYVKTDRNNENEKNTGVQTDNSDKSTTVDKNTNTGEQLKENSAVDTGDSADIHFVMLVLFISFVFILIISWCRFRSNRSKKRNNVDRIIALFLAVGMSLSLMHGITANAEGAGSESYEDVDESEESLYEKALESCVSPLDVYNYVRKNVSSKPGLNGGYSAETVLELGRTNASENAVLLGSLLKDKGFEVKFVYGRALLTKEQAEWVCSEDELNKVSEIDDDPDIRSIEIKEDETGETLYSIPHVWVKALIPVTDYRCAGKCCGEMMWVELDSYIKPSDANDVQNLTLMPLSLQYETTGINGEITPKDYDELPEDIYTEKAPPKKEYIRSFDTAADFSSDGSVITDGNTEIDETYLYYADIYDGNTYGIETDGDSACVSLAGNNSRDAGLYEKYSFSGIDVVEDFDGEVKIDPEDDKERFKGLLKLNIKSSNEKHVNDISLYDGHAYGVSEDILRWEDAEKVCEGMGGHLVVINNARENEFVRNLINSSNLDGFLYTAIGYSDSRSEGTWEWIDGSDSGYTNWSVNEPNNGGDYVLGGQDHAFMLEAGDWDDGSGEGSDIHFYVCEWDKVSDISSYELSNALVSMTVDKNAVIADEFADNSQIKVAEKESGEKTVTWKVDLREESQLELPIKMEKTVMYENIIRDINVFYNTGDEICSEKLKDVDFAENEYFSGPAYWIKMLDSEEEGSEWTYFDIDALYETNGQCEVYGYASDNLSDFNRLDKYDYKYIDMKQAATKQGITGLTGRYLALRVVFYASIKKTIPYLNAVTVGANTDKRPSSDKMDIKKLEISGRDTVNRNEVVRYELLGVSTYQNSGTIIWSINDEIVPQDQLDYRGLLFSQKEAGEYVIRAYYPDMPEKYVEKKVVVTDEDELGQESTGADILKIPVFNIILDKPLYTEGEDVKAETDIPDGVNINITYDGELLNDISVEDESEGEDIKRSFTIPDVKEGNHTLEVRATNESGNSFTHSVSFTVNKGNKTIQTWFDKDRYFYGDDVTLFVEDGYSIKSADLDDFEITQIDESGSSVLFTKPEAGIHKIKIMVSKDSTLQPEGDVETASSSDTDDNEAEEIELYLFINDAPMDTRAPMVKITYPDDQTVITIDGKESPDDEEDKYNVEIRGTVKEETELDHYKLSIKEAEKDYEYFREIARGYGNSDDEKIAEINTDELKTGYYILRLEAKDKGGNIGYSEIVLKIDRKSDKPEEQSTPSDATPTDPSQDPDTPTPTDPTKEPEDEKDYPGLVISLNDKRVKVNTAVTAEIEISPKADKEKLKLYVNDTEIDQAELVEKNSDGISVENKKIYTYQFTSDKKGRVAVKAVFEDVGKEIRKEAESSCYFYTDENDTDKPVAEINIPDFLSPLSVPVEITGTASDEMELEEWKLEYRMKDSSGENNSASSDVLSEKDYQLIGSGSENVTDDKLGYLDTTMLMNGIYEMRLTVTDGVGHTSIDSHEFIVEGNLKIGNLHIGFTDITAALGGTTVNLNRIYDSRNKKSSDFGYGWSLDMQGMRLYESHDITEGYEMIESGSALSKVYTLRETDKHDVIVTYGDGRSDRFSLVINNGISVLTPVSEVSFGYRCETNQKVKLEILADTSAIYEWGELAFADDGMYEMLDYRLTTEQGEKLYINSERGVYRLEDTAGHVINVDKNGYHAEDGKSLELERDDEGRIVSATDPLGNTTTYTYDEKGNLAGVTDSADRTVTYTYDDDHNLLSITDPMGIAVERNEYGQDGRLIATIDAEGNRTEYSHDVEGREEVITDRLGNKELYIYDDHGNILEKTDANGKKISYTYDEYGNAITFKDAKGNITKTEYDARGNVIAVTDAMGHEIRTEYDSNNKPVKVTTVDSYSILIGYNDLGYMTSTADVNGSTRDYTRDSDGNIRSISDEIGTVINAEYNAQGQVISSTDSAGNKTEYTYDEKGNRISETTIIRTEQGETEKTIRYIYNNAGEVTSVIDADGNQTVLERNKNGRLTSAIDAEGRTTGYEYDRLGQLIRISYSDGTSESFTYDACGRMTESVDRIGGKEKYSYDKVGNLIKKTDTRGNEITFEYDDNYNLTEVGYPTGRTLTYSYDELNRNTEINEDGERVAEFTYDDRSLVTSVTDAKGNVTRYEYDSRGERVKTIYPDGTEESIETDSRGRCISKTSVSGKKTEYKYDSGDRLTEVVINDDEITRYKYDETGNLLSVVDALGNETKYSYDENSRLIKTTLPDGAESTYEYDRYGRLVGGKDCNGLSQKYTYDKESRPTDIRKGNKNIHIAYDEFGRIRTLKSEDSKIEYSYNEYGELSEKCYDDLEKISYSYDKYGRETEKIVSSKDKQLYSTQYEYDDRNRVTRVIGHDGLATVYTYDENGNRESATYANGVVLTYTYDECNRLIFQKVTDRTERLLASYKYTIENGEISKIEEEGPEGKITTEYTYDAAERLICEETKTENNGSVKTDKVEYEYDKVGNRIRQVVNGKEISYTYNTRNQLIRVEDRNFTTLYEYDSNGNLISKNNGTAEDEFIYDEFDRMTGFRQNGLSYSYGYDAEGVRRYKKNDTGDDYTEYISDTNGGLSQIVAEVDKNGNLITGYDVCGEIIKSCTDEESCYYIYDGHGSVRFITDKEGKVKSTYSYSAYGELRSQSGNVDNSYLYCGENYDAETGLYYLRARYMDPSTGTFTGSDSYSGNITDPSTLHKYLYAGDNPVKYSDPSGYSFDIISQMVASGIASILQNSYSICLMGMMNSMVAGATTKLLGGNDDQVFSSMIKGFALGSFLGALSFFVMACFSLSLINVMLCSSAASVGTNFLMTLYSAFQGKTEDAVTYGIMSILSLIELKVFYGLETPDTISDDNIKDKANIDVKKYSSKGGSGTNTSWYNQDGSMNYPPNNGAVPGTEVKITLKPGDTIGRYGNIGEKSNFVTQTGADANQLALPPNTDPNIYQEFEVVKEIPDTIQAVVAPWGGSEGGGLQYELPKSILQLIREGYIVPK